MTLGVDAGVSAFLVDDHPLVREGLRLMLEGAGYGIAGEAAGARAALAHPALASAGVVLLDLSLEQENGLDLIPVLRERGLRVVVYTMHEEPAVVRRAIAAGAAGYVTKREAAHSLVEAVRAVTGGDTYVSARVADALSGRSAGPDLSPQQQQVYDLLGHGFDTTEIAERLHVSPRTVEGYCTRLMDKLGLDGMKELRRRAIADVTQHRV